MTEAQISYRYIPSTQTVFLAHFINIVDNDLTSLMGRILRYVPDEEPTSITLNPSVILYYRACAAIADHLVIVGGERHGAR